VERRPRAHRHAKPRRVAKKPTNPSTPSGPADADLVFPNIEWLIEGGGDITVGAIGSIPCAASAADQNICYAMLVRRKDESVLDLLLRLDRSIKVAAADNTTIDEVNS